MSWHRKTQSQILGACALLAGLVTLTAAPRVEAEPALDRVLASVQASNQKSCTALSIAFNLRIRYLSHFPVGQGQELRIQLRPIDGAQAAAEILTRRESLRSPDTKFGHIRAIDFEAGQAAGPSLVIQFQESVHYEVSQGGDFQSLIVTIFNGSGASGCKADFQNQTGLGGWSTSVTPSVSDNAAAPVGHAAKHGGGTASDAQKKQASALMDEARAALKKHDFDAAAAKFKQVLKLPETDNSAEAQEMLGIALQKTKKNDEARANYEDYLARYPSGEGAERVRQRLDGILTASGDRSGQPNFSSPGGTSGSKDNGTQTWTLSGSASQFYIRDDSFRTVRDPSLPQAINDDLDTHRTHQNELLSSLDAIATWNGNGTRGKLRFSGTEEHKFDKDDEIAGVAALFMDIAVKEWGAETRVGRQTRNSGGVLGRFDGAVFSVDAAKGYRLNAVAGSPVARRRDMPFADDKYFYGGSLDIGPFNGMDVSVFAIEQRDRDVIDRQAAGAEARYFDADKSAFAMLDYDVHYETLNAAVLNGSWTLADKTTLHGAFDYRKSPYLSTWTALQSQGYPTLYELLRHKTLAEVEQLALDRTASFTSISGGFARPINDMFQVSLDVTATNFGGTNASPDIPATQGTGNEYFYAAQLIGNKVFTTDDLLIVGARFADLQNSNYYVADLSYRFPLMESLKINPRLMASYRTGATTDLVEYSVLPSVLLDYYFTKDLSLELEAGARWTQTTENAVRETSTDLFFTIGYRYDFYADGSLEQKVRAAPYGAGAPK